MGKNSNVREEIDHSQIDTETTQTNSSLLDTTPEETLLHKEEPHELEQKASRTASSFSPQDEVTSFNQTITVTEIIPTPEDTIDDMITTPEVVPFVVEQKALVVIPRHLPPAVIRKNRKGGIVSTVVGSSYRSKQRGKGSLFFALAAIVLFFVVISGSYVVLSANADTGNSNTKNQIASFTFPQFSSTTAAVTITPSHGIVNHTYTIALVTGQPDPTQNQVEGARIITSSQSQSTQVRATGKVTSPAISSTGTLVFSRVRSRKPVTIPAGTSFPGKNNVALILNTSITLRARVPAVSVSAHAYPAGIHGNVPALDINGTFCYPNCLTGVAFHLQSTAFTGGKAAQSYIFIQQSDINTAASQLEHTLAILSQSAIQSQIGTYEQQAGSIGCGLSSLSSNQQVGARVPDVTVFVTERCQGEVYSVQAALNLAKKLLHTDVTTLIGPGYSIAGGVTTQVLSQPEIIDTQGTLSLKVMARGTAFYQVTSTKKQALANLIAGKSLTEAQDLLSNQIGIAHATITISDNSADKLPDDASKINVAVVK
ncbi:MAG: hypothetical protein ACXVBU_00285 [Ktedonobacteraceae bacterium]